MLGGLDKSRNAFSVTATVGAAFKAEFLSWNKKRSARDEVIAGDYHVVIKDRENELLIIYHEHR